jgi:GAF domain-containing protein
MTESRSSSQELFFLYELAKALAASIELGEATENVIDGTCALLGTEQGFLYTVDPTGTLVPHASRGLPEADLRALVGQVQPAVAERRALAIEHPHNPQGAILVAPLLARNAVQGLVGVGTAYARRFTPQEQERLASVAHLASLALENARMHEKVQREVAVLRRLIQAAQRMAAGQLSAEEAAELEKIEGWDEISHLGKAFGQMAQQVIQREDDLRREVAQLRFEIDETRKARQVAEITETQYFQELRQKAKELRKPGPGQ